MCTHSQFDHDRIYYREAREGEMVKEKRRETTLTHLFSRAPQANVQSSTCIKPGPPSLPCRYRWVRAFLTSQQLEPTDVVTLLTYSSSLF